MKKQISLSFILALSLHSEPITLQNGWNLLGTDQDLMLSDINKSCIETVWTYKSGNWSAFSPNNELQNQINTNPNISSLSTITANSGFWIATNSECSLDSATTTTAFRLINSLNLQNSSANLLAFRYPYGIVSQTFSTPYDLKILDFSTTEPTTIATIPESVGVKKVLFDNQKLFVCTGDYSGTYDIIDVFDITTINSPKKIESLSGQNGTLLGIQNNHLFMNRDNKLTIFSITDTNTTFVSDINLSAGYFMLVEGNYIYTSENYNNIDIIDISNIAKPQLITQISDVSFFPETKIGNTIFARSYPSYNQYCIKSIDVTNPSTPIVGDDFLCQDRTNYYAHGFTNSQRDLIITKEHGIMTFNIDTNESHEYPYDADGCNGMFADDTHLFVSKQNFTDDWSETNTTVKLFNLE